jgi:hypothetical protein
MNSSGQVAVFFLQNGTYYFNRFTPAIGWETPQAVATGNSNLAVAINDSGNSILLYASGTDVFSRLVNGSTLQAAVTVNTAGRMVIPTDLDVRVALNNNRAVALWQDKASSGSSTLDLQLGSYDTATNTWTTSTLSAGLNTLDNICLRINANGQAVAAWRTNKPSLISRIEATFINTTGTPTVQDLTRGNPARCSINASGAALVAAVAQNSAGIADGVKAFAYSSGWDAGTLLFSPTSPDFWNVTDPHIALNASGNALIGAYNATTSALTTDRIAQFRVLSGGSWQATQTLTGIDPNGQDSYTRHINFDDSGNGFYIFQTSDSASLATRGSVQVLYYR